MNPEAQYYLVIPEVLWGRVIPEAQSDRQTVLWDPEDRLDQSVLGNQTQVVLLAPRHPLGQICQSVPQDQRRL